MNELINFIQSRCKDVAFPERVLVCSEKEFYDIVDVYNGIKDRIYFSIYDCDEYRNFDNASIHCVGFDLDSDNALSNLDKLYNYCLSNNYKLLMLFSTRGFWAYIFCRGYNLLKNKKVTLTNATLHIAKENNLSIGNNPHTDDIDFHIIGDISRIARLPNGYDVKRKRYCIPITIEDVTKGYTWICEKSKQQCFDFVYYNTDYFDISRFDGEPEKVAELDFTGVNLEVNCDDKVINGFLPCIKNCVVNTSLKSHNLFWVWTTIYLREQGFSTENIKQIVKPYLEKHLRDDGFGRNDYEHYVFHDHLPESVFSKHYYFPNCPKLQQSKFCCGTCSKYSNKSLVYK